MLGFLEVLRGNNTIRDEENAKTAKLLREMASALRKGSTEVGRKQQCAGVALGHLKETLKLLDKESDEWKHTMNAVRALADLVSEPGSTQLDISPYENTFATTEPTGDS